MLCLRTGRGDQCTCFCRFLCSTRSFRSHPFSRSDIDRSLVSVTAVVSTPTSTLCGSPTVLSIVVYYLHAWRLSCNTRKQQISDEVSRLAAAPRRPSTNRMYDVRWHRFTHWATQEGFDPLNPSAAQIATFLYSLFDTYGLSPQTLKGYRTCLGSVLNWTSKAKVVQHKTISNMICKVVQHKTISDMIASMELQT